MHATNANSDGARQTKNTQDLDESLHGFNLSMRRSSMKIRVLPFTKRRAEGVDMQIDRDDKAPV